MHRVTTTLLAVGLIAVMLAAPAMAHSGIMPSRMAPETTEDAELVLVHGCGENGTIPGGDDATFATTGVTLQVPEALDVVPQDVEGWQLETEPRDDGGVSQVRWESIDPGGTLDTIRFGLDVTAPDAPAETQLWLPVLQECTDGEQLSWTHPGAETPVGQHPATLLTIGELTSPAGTGGGLPTSVLVTIVAAIAVASGAVVYVITGRRL